MVENTRHIAKLFEGEAQHVFASPQEAPLPEELYPEVAFIGRSNVGKSSLINALLRRKKLARTSNTPGATRAIHFYDIACTFYVVDLPGYGYAKISKALSQSLSEHVSHYLRTRSTLKAVCVLVDSRHGLKKSDADMIEELAQNGLPSLIVLTKADKLKPHQQKGIVNFVQKALVNQVGPLAEPLLTSAEKSFGLEELQIMIYNALGLEAKAER